MLKNLVYRKKNCQGVQRIGLDGGADGEGGVGLYVEGVTTIILDSRFFFPFCCPFLRLFSSVFVSKSCNSFLSPTSRFYRYLLLTNNP